MPTKCITVNVNIIVYLNAYISLYFSSELLFITELCLGDFRGSS